MGACWSTIFYPDPAGNWVKFIGLLFFSLLPLTQCRFCPAFFQEDQEYCASGFSSSFLSQGFTDILEKMLVGLYVLMML